MDHFSTFSLRLHFRTGGSALNIDTNFNSIGVKSLQITINRVASDQDDFAPLEFVWYIRRGTLAGHCSIFFFQLYYTHLIIV